jgi:type III secretory pathway lipoprotein EscJ
MNRRRGAPLLALLVLLLLSACKVELFSGLGEH